MSERKYYRCPVCNGRAWLEPGNQNLIYAIHCMRCGDFRANHYFCIQMPRAGASRTQVANIAGYIRENPSLLLTEEQIPALVSLPTPSISEKAMKLLSLLRRLEPRPGRNIDARFTYEVDGQLKIMEEALPPLSTDPFPSDPVSEQTAKGGLTFLGGAWAEDQTELRYLIDLLEQRNLIVTAIQGMLLCITGDGWDFLQTRPDSLGDTCFVAMWFDDSMTPIFTGPISTGIRNAGYKPFRVDNREHNNDITDEIIAGIRTSRFLLADFTGHRGGVYYEAGFAVGLGKPVVRTVREDHASEIHFDTRQISHIIWKADALDAFARAITVRIVATIGPGPLPIPDAG